MTVTYKPDGLTSEGYIDGNETSPPFNSAIGQIRVWHFDTAAGGSISASVTIPAGGGSALVSINIFDHLGNAIGGGSSGVSGPSGFTVALAPLTVIPRKRYFIRVLSTTGAGQGPIVNGTVKLNSGAVAIMADPGLGDDTGYFVEPSALTPLVVNRTWEIATTGIPTVVPRPTSGQLWPRSGGGGQQGPVGPAGPTGPSGQAAGRVYYLASSDASDISTYKTLLESPSAGAEQTIATVCTGVNVDFLVATFATDPGVPGAVDYPAGTGYRRIYAMLSSGTARFRLMVYKRNAAGTETLLRDEYSPNFTDQVVAAQEWAATAAGAGAMLATDRIVTKLYAQRITGGGGTITVTTYYEGTAHTSQIQTTISVGAQGPVGPPGPAGTVYARLTGTTTSLPSAGTSTALSWPTETQDPSNLHVAGTPTRLTAGTAGFYLVIAHIVFPADATRTGYRWSMIYKNGVFGAQSAIVPTQYTQDVQVSELLYLNATDYVEAWGAQTSSAAMTPAAGSFFALAMLGA